jgi:hypothetical protein
MGQGGDEAISYYNTSDYEIIKTAFSPPAPRMGYSGNKIGKDFLSD